VAAAWRASENSPRKLSLLEDLQKEATGPRRVVDEEATRAAHCHVLLDGLDLHGTLQTVLVDDVAAAALAHHSSVRAQCHLLLTLRASVQPPLLW